MGLRAFVMGRVRSLPFSPNVETSLSWTCHVSGRLVSNVPWYLYFALLSQRGCSWLLVFCRIYVYSCILNGMILYSKGCINMLGMQGVFVMIRSMVEVFWAGILLPLYLHKRRRSPPKSKGAKQNQQNYYEPRNTQTQVLEENERLLEAELQISQVSN